MQIIKETKKINVSSKFNHFTLNTGHNLIQDASSIFVNDKIREQIKKIIDEAKKGTITAKVIDCGLFEVFGTYVKITTDENGFAVSIFMDSDGFLLPIVTSVGCWSEASADLVWDVILKMGETYAVNNISSYINMRPKAPFICDVLFLPGYAKFIADILYGVDWTSDFFRCVAAILFSQHHDLEKP